MAKRVAETRLKGRAGYPAEDPFRVTLAEDKLDEPLHWRKPQTVMTCSMGDLFHDQVPDIYIMAVLGIAALAKGHTIMFFTKRVERALEIFRSIDRRAATASRDVFPHEDLDWCRWHVLRAAALIESGAPLPGIPEDHPWPPRNLWIIASASTQAEVDRIVPVLLRIPAAKRGLSLEPLVRPVGLDHIDAEAAGDPEWCWINALTGRHTDMGRPCPDVPHLDWVIVGCELGPQRDRRAMLLSWARVLRDQCVQARVSFYLKQAVANGVVTPHPQLDGRQWMEIPDSGEGEV